jgi:hypothetical protein
VSLTGAGVVLVEDQDDTDHAVEDQTRAGAIAPARVTFPA